MNIRSKSDTNGIQCSPNGYPEGDGKDDGAARRELTVFVLLAVVLAPVISVIVVGGYGFAVWMLQHFTGPPTG